MGGFVKVVKNKAYFKRFQVKYRRRREGKTDYRARKRLVNQEKNKYNSPKYRFVARFTNQNVICQVIYSKITGDHVVAAAYSRELTNYGLTVGLTNYAAAYSTGLLLARRLLASKGIDKQFEGEKDVTGKVTHQGNSADDGRRPFKCLLDVGLARTTTGAKVFAAMKGACDGGLFIPHNEKRFVGFHGGDFKPEVLRSHIFGAHIAAYMKYLKKPESKKDYNLQQFSRYAKAVDGEITEKKLEQLYKSVHAKIRANPARAKKAATKDHPKSKNKSRQSLKVRRARSDQKIAYIRWKKSQ